MRKLILILILLVAIPIIAQEPEAKTQWVLDDLSIIALQDFQKRYQRDYLELLKVIKATEMRLNPDMPEEAKLNEQLMAFVIPKPKEIKKQ